MYVVFVLVAAAVVFAVVAVTLGRGTMLDDDPPVVAGPQLSDQALQETDLTDVRFAVALRGYRMDQVDDVLARVGEELTWRDERIAELEDTLRTWSASEMARHTRPAWEDD